MGVVVFFFMTTEERMVLQTGSNDSHLDKCPCMFNRLEMVPVETWGLVCS